MILYVIGPHPLSLRLASHGAVIPRTLIRLNMLRLIILGLTAN
jgi:hypothetical protein